MEQVTSTPAYCNRIERLQLLQDSLPIRKRGVRAGETIFQVGRRSVASTW